MTDDIPTSVAPSLKVRLVVAFFLIAGIVTADYVLEYTKAAAVENSAYAINLAGRQRMLSQRIAALSETYLRYLDEAPKSSEDNKDAASVRQDLHAAIDRMAKEHAMLTEGAPAQKMIPPSGALGRHYFEGTPSLDQQVETFLAKARTIAEASETTPSLDAVLQDVLRQARTPLLNQLDRAVSLKEESAKTTAEEMANLNSALFAMTLAGLLAVFLLFVRPTVRLVERKVGELSTKNAELDEEARRREEVIWGTSAGTWEWNVQTGETIFNERWAEIIGYCLEELKPVSIETWLSFAHPDDLKISGERLEAHFAGNVDYYECEARMRHRDGHWVWVLDRGKVVEWTADGAPLRISGTHTDITERKKAEEALAKTSEDLREAADAAAEQRTKAIRAEQILLTAIDTIDDGFVLYDDKDRLVLCNERYRDMYSKSAHAMTTGATFEEVLRAGLQRGEYAEAVGREEEWLKERLSAHDRLKPVAHQLDDGRWIRVTERRTSGGGRVGLRVDITDLVAAKSEAEKAAQSKSEFLASMSHEIRTPLNGVLGILQLLENERLSETATERLKVAKESGFFLLALIDQVLDFSRIEAGQVAVEREPFNLDSMLDEFGSMFSQQAHLKRLDLEVVRAPEAPTRLVGDYVHIRQILFNLIGNALKFTESGRVSIDAAVETGGGGANTLTVNVADTGPGLNEDEQSLIFQRFSQTSSGRRKGGAGLGLSISIRLAEAMGGALTLRSEPGRGSVFTFTTPVDFAADREDAKGDGDSTPILGAPIGPINVLVAEDNAVNQMIVRSMLEQDGHHVQVVGTGRAACEAATEMSTRYDLVLMDVQMPDLDGVEATTVIRNMGVSESALPIVALTANAFEDQRAAYLAAGMQDVLTKPLRLDALRAILQRYAPPLATAPADLGAEEGAPSNAESEASILDGAVVEQLFETVPVAVLETLLETVSAEKVRLVDAATSSRGDSERLRQIGHELKGMLVSFGLKEAAAAASRIETESLTPEDVDSQVEALDAAYALGVAQIQARFRETEVGSPSMEDHDDLA